MSTRMRPKGVLGVAALALALLPFVAYPATAIANSTSCSASGTIKGYVVMRAPAVGNGWSFTVTSSEVTGSTPALVKGVLTGTFSASDFGINTAVNGGWMYRSNDGALFVKFVGNGFSVDLAIMPLPSAGFTFSGNLFVASIAQPVALVSMPPSTLSCS